MGEVVGAGLLAHVPTIMLPEATRRELNHGQEITLVSRAAAAARRGLRDPRLRHGRRPRLALGHDRRVRRHRPRPARRAVHLRGAAARDVPQAVRLPRRPRARARRSPRRPTRTARGSPRSTTSTCRSSTPPSTCGSTSARACPTSAGSPSASARPPTPRTTCALGRALGDAIAATDRKVLLIASGRHVAHVLAAAGAPRPRGRRHRAHLHARGGARPTSSGSRWFAEGDHAQVLETMPEFYRFRPEARFGALPDDDRRAGRGRLHRADVRRTASTRTPSAPARCTSGSTAPRVASPDRAAPSSRGA